MGVMETKIIQVKNDPYEINASNEAWGRWGWSVLSVQVTHSQNTKEYQDWAQYGSNEVTVETTTINYATITYQRDKSMPGYERIMELEQEFNQVENRVQSQFKARREELYNAKQKLPKPNESGWGTFVIALFCACISVFGLFMLLKDWERYNIATSLIEICIFAIAFLFLFSRWMKSRTPENQALRTQRDQMQNTIDSELAEMESKASSMIKTEKARIIDEAAHLLRMA